MLANVMLTGVLPFVVLVASALAVPVSLLLLRLYRNAVQRGMSGLGGETLRRPQGVEVRRTPASQLHIRSRAHTASEAPPDRIPAAYRLAIQGPWRTAGVYTAAGACYAAVMTAGWLAATQDKTIVWTKVLFLFWQYVWPAAIAVVLVAAYDRAKRRQLFAAYFIVFLALSGIAMARNPNLGIGQLILSWVIINGPPTMLAIAFLLRPIRAVGPLVLAFLLAASIGSQTLLSMASVTDGILMPIAQIGFSLGLNAIMVFIGMILLGMLVFGLLGWRLLNFLGRLYEQKKLSDQSIMLDALWLLFAVVQSIGLAFEGSAWILTGVAAFIGYKLVVKIAFRWTVAARPTTEPRTLLLLRVFALGKRSEGLFDKLRKHWQYAGSISMIAGPDLVTSTVEPHEFLEFVRGHLARRFVCGAQDLERRMATVDKAPDLDGRYRVREFFCHDDTWQLSMERLAATSDAVLMDLRSFSPANRGCIFELGRLLNGMDLARIVFLVDGSTDLDFLETTLRDLWQNLGADSPNQAATEPTVRLFRIGEQSEKELGGLLYLLMGEIPATAVMLIGLSGPVEGKRFPVDKHGVLIGRNPGNDLAIPQDEHVSGSHAYLCHEKSGVLIIDRNSRNGTFVNDNELGETGHVLTSGDRIRIGNSILEVRII